MSDGFRRRGRGFRRHERFIDDLPEKYLKSGGYFDWRDVVVRHRGTFVDVRGRDANV